MDLLSIMVLLSIKNQAGPAQDPWPPKPKPSLGKGVSGILDCKPLGPGPGGWAPDP